MSGIYACAGHTEAAAELVLEGLKRFDYASYDSWGIGVPDSGNAKLERRLGKVSPTRLELPPTNVALGHTRRATDGDVSPANAHPQVDCACRIAVTHNGTVFNHQALRAELEARGHTFQSATDTEVIPHLIEELLAQGLSLREAATRTFRQLEGDNAICVLDVQSGAIGAIQRGLPLALGWADEGHFVTSDPVALVGHIRRIAFLEDDQFALINPVEIVVHDPAGNEVSPPVTILDFDRSHGTRGAHARLLAACIRDRSEALRELAAHDGPQELAGALAAGAPLILTGHGSAYHAALAGRYAFSRVAGRLATCIPACELPYVLRAQAGFTAPEGSRIQWGPGTPWLIAVSDSGESTEVLDAVRAARGQGMSVAALTPANGSSLCRMADVVVALNPERLDLFGAAFAAQVAALALLAWRLAGSVDMGRRSLERALVTCEQVAADVAARELARRLVNAPRLVLVGSGIAYPAALQGALRLNLHSPAVGAAFNSGDLESGALGLVDSRMACLILAPRDEALPAAVSAAREVRQRGAATVGLASAGHSNFDALFPVPDCGELSVLALTVAVQTIACSLADLRAERTSSRGQPRLEAHALASA